MIKITTHTIVKNEENWVWYSLMSVKDAVERMLVFDDHSTDHTAEIIKMIKDPKIKFDSGSLNSPEDHTRARNTMIRETETDWFMLLDGDEVWNEKTLRALRQLLERAGPEIYGVAMRTRNCVGDIYHYLPEEAGNYRLLGRKGHLTIRAYRKLPGFSWRGNYPLEAYTDGEGRPVNNQEEHLRFFDAYYWHLTHLKRSGSRESVKGWRKRKYEIGITVGDKAEFPEVFSLPGPEIAPSPWVKMDDGEYLLSMLATPLKRLKRKLL